MVYFICFSVFYLFFHKTFCTPILLLSVSLPANLLVSKALRKTFGFFQEMSNLLNILILLIFNLEKKNFTQSCYLAMNSTHHFPISLFFRWHWIILYMSFSETKHFPSIYRWPQLPFTEPLENITLSINMI